MSTLAVIRFKGDTATFRRALDERAATARPSWAAGPAEVGGWPG